MAEVDKLEDAIPTELSFEQEYNIQKAAAPLYKNSDVFRLNIVKSCREVFYGQRSTANFVKLASALILDKDDDFKQHQLPIKTYYFNSIKSYENLWDEIFELKKANEDRQNAPDPENIRKYKLYTTRLVNIIKGLVDSGAISIGECKQNFHSGLLFECGYVQNHRLFDRRLVRLNTALLYKQDKYNLSREASEGYASLFNDLTTASIDNERDIKGKLVATPLDRIPLFLEIITAHMGEFHLDPNRVLDIILDFFIRQLMVNYNFWVELIKQTDWIEKVKDEQGDITYKPSSNMGQLFGFRFYNYHMEKVAAPKELYLSIAILLKNNLLLLGDLIPYLYPTEAEMEEAKKQYNANMNREITTSSGGALALYGALGEEGATQKMGQRPSSSEEDGSENDGTEEIRKKYSANDVVELTRALISIGDLKNVETIWAHYEKLFDLHPELAHDIYRLCKVMLQPAYDAFVSEKIKKRVNTLKERAQQSRMKSALTSLDNLNPSIPDNIPTKRVLVLDALLDGTEDLVKKERYVFFFKEWRQDLPQCTQAEHLTSRFLPLMRLAGYRTYLATDLLQTLNYILESIIDSNANVPNGRLHCTNMLREIVLPSISFSEHNPGTIADAWEVCCRLTFQERYALYGEWFNDFYKKSVETKLLKAHTEREIKDIMRRVAKNDVRRSGRDLGKLAHSNPTIVFNIMLDQIQQMDNLATLIPDACRYLGDCAYDVLGYVLTEKWTGSQGAGKMVKKKEKDDGMPATWLRSLAVFTGMVFKKQSIDVAPLLRYVAARLRYPDSVPDLILLNEFVTKLGGIEILGSATTDDQVIAAGCADSVKSEAFLAVDVENRRANRRVLERLKESLRRNNVGLEILILTVFLEESVLIERGVPASDRSARLDRVHQAQSQYFQLFTELFEGEEYAALMPDVDALVKEYGLPMNVALRLNRPKMQLKIKNSMDVPVVEGQVWEPFQALTQAVPDLMNSPSWMSIFPAEFYIIFWQLSNYDIFCPESQYENAMKIQTEIIRQCKDPRSQLCLTNRPNTVTKKERQAESTLEAIKKDLQQHKTHVAKVMSVLEESKKRWFPNLNQRTAQIASILQHCFLPRSRQSEMDAAFCYEFTMLMHRLNVPQFSSLTLFDKLFSDITPCFIAFTEYETTIYARYIFKAFSKMQAWHNDEKLYVKEAHDVVGFQKNWSAVPTPVEKEDLLSFNDFQRVLNRWHIKCTASIAQALKSGEQHVMKNAFLVLRQFIPCYPAVVDHGNIIVSIVTKLAEEESRGNLKVLARSYLGLIKNYREKWVSKNRFLNLEEPAPPVEIRIAPPPPPSTSSPSANTANNTHAASSSTESKDKASGGSNSTSTSRRNDTSNSSNNNTSSTSRSDDTSRKRDSTESKQPASASSTSRNDSPSRRSDDKSSKRNDSPERKRSRDREPISSGRSDKVPRVDESSSDRRHYRTSTSSSSSRRTSPRDTKDGSSSRIHTPLRSSNDPGRSREMARDSVREPSRSGASTRENGAREPSSRDAAPVNNSSGSRDAERDGRKDPSAPVPRGRGASSVSHSTAPSSNSRIDDRLNRPSSSSRNQTEVNNSSSSRRDDRTTSVNNGSSTSNNNNNGSSSTSGGRTVSIGSKRPAESDRDRERDKRRDIRDDRVRVERRPDDRSGGRGGAEDRRREDRRVDDRRVDDRRLDDRRVDDRRERERHDRRRRH
ncbi:THO complex subunit Tho2 [Mucor ambiguus]|uniref:THO complex subunit 2 n=1 Tax=Mucor ambiguus TaxID=91626 RepID=A0A0C9M5S1_9FUNG|nr:THO complex subunit Tho2 [Mucor ambiguus]